MTLLQQALEALEVSMPINLQHTERGFTQHHAAITALRAAIEQGMVVQQWRSVEAELPEPEVDVLCYGMNRMLASRMMFVDWYGSKPDFGRGVTHWQPLPPAPITQEDV